MVDYASGAKEQGLQLHRFRSRPIEFGESLECLLHEVRWNDCLRARIKRRAVQQKPERREEMSIVLLLLGVSRSGINEQVDQFRFRFATDALERSREKNELGRWACLLAELPDLGGEDAFLPFA